MIVKKDPNQYGSIIFETHCSNSCVFCGGTKKVSKNGKTRQEKTALESLKHFKSKGFQCIDISGGDPIEYEDLLPFARKINDSGFKTIQLSTHGMGLAEDGLCEDLISAGVNKFRIPIYGSVAKIHDAVTRNEGSFKKTMAGIKRILKGNGIKLQVSTLITKHNGSDILNMMKLMDNLGIDDFYIGTPCIAKGDYSFYIPFKDIGVYIEKPYNHILKNDKKFYFLDIPFCVFKKTNFKVIRFAQTPSLGKHKNNRYSIIGGVPFYRIQKQVPMCQNCRMNDVCPGFFEVDINKFGTGNLEPL